MVLLDGPQASWVTLDDGRRVLNLCSNDYLGLASDPIAIEAAKDALDRWGFGLASGRVICGSLTLHRQLEQEVSALLGTDDTVLYTSCLDANAGLFEPLLGPDDAVISDRLNHASIIDGIRLCKARRFTYPTRDLDALRAILAGEAAGAGRRLVVTDGVFSMDGGVADVGALCDIAEEHGALLAVDDSHATGIVGPGGRGTVGDPEVAGRVDLITGTFGKALGGAGGGFTSGRRELVDVLRATSRSYVFTNAMPPTTAAVALAALRLGDEGDARRARAAANAALLRSLLAERGFTIPDGTHPITPVIVGDSEHARAMADALLEQGVLAVALGYPIVAADAARIRLQVTAAHTEDDLRHAADALARVR